MQIRQRLYIISPTICFFIFCDQVTKFVAKYLLQGNEPVLFLDGIITFSYVENPFGFLGILTHIPENIRSFALLFGVLLLLIVVISYTLISNNLSRAHIFYLSLIGAGGTSNLLDRLVQQTGVIDYISFGYGTMRTGLFNLADIYILFGSFFLGFLIAKTL